MPVLDVYGQARQTVNNETAKLPSFILYYVSGHAIRRGTPNKMSQCCITSALTKVRLFFLFLCPSLVLLSLSRFSATSASISWHIHDALCFTSVCGALCRTPSPPLAPPGAPEVHGQTLRAITGLLCGRRRRALHADPLPLLHEAAAPDTIAF